MFAFGLFTQVSDSGPQGPLVFFFFWGGGGGGDREREKIADTMNIETASAIFYCRFGYYYKWSTSSIFKE